MGEEPLSAVAHPFLRRLMQSRQTGMYSKSISTARGKILQCSRWVGNDPEPPLVDMSARDVTTDAQNVHQREESDTDDTTRPPAISRDQFGVVWCDTARGCSLHRTRHCGGGERIGVSMGGSLAGAGACAGVIERRQSAAPAQFVNDEASVRTAAGPPSS